MKIIITENRLEKFVVEWLDKNYGDLKPYDYKTNPILILYKQNKDSETIFSYNKKNKYVNISNSEIWSMLQKFFKMDYRQIQKLMKYWIRDRYNLDVMETL